MSYIIQYIVVGIVISLFFRPTWFVLSKLAGVFYFLLKLLIVVGLMAGFCNSTQTYRAIGWTPVSILIGDKVYKR